MMGIRREERGEWAREAARGAGYRRYGFERVIWPIRVAPRNL